MNNKTDRVWRSKSLNLVAYILSTGKVKILGLDRSNPKEVTFLLENPEICEQLVSNFWLDKATVNPKTLLAKLSELKDQIFEGGNY